MKGETVKIALKSYPNMARAFVDQLERTEHGLYDQPDIVVIEKLFKGSERCPRKVRRKKV